jgi:hypothetical protein
MKQGAKIELNKLQHQERIKNIVRVFCVIIALATLFSAISIYRFAPGATFEVSGTITGLIGVPAPKMGDILYLIVKLDNGKVIEVKKPNYISYKKGERILLKEIKTSIFGNTRYDFIAYSKSN